MKVHGLELNDSILVGCTSSLLLPKPTHESSMNSFRGRWESDFAGDAKREAFRVSCGGRRGRESLRGLGVSYVVVK